MIIWGIDPGQFKHALAELEVDGQGIRVRQALSLVHTEMEACIQSRPRPDLAVVEETEGTYWNNRRKPGIRQGLRQTRQAEERLLDLLAERGIPTISLPCAGNWEDPGWRQRLTGLTRPSEWDVWQELMTRRRGGQLQGYIPRHPHLVDAIGLALIGLKIGGRDGSLQPQLYCDLSGCA